MVPSFSLKSDRSFKTFFFFRATPDVWNKQDCLWTHRATEGQISQEVSQPGLLLLPRKYTVELQWLKQLWNHENMFKTGEVQANVC